MIMICHYVIHATKYKTLEIPLNCTLGIPTFELTFIRMFNEQVKGKIAFPKGLLERVLYGNEFS